MKYNQSIPPIHPGEILLEDYLRPLNISQNELSLKMRIPPQRISDIVNGKRSISPDTAIRLAKVIGTTAKFWLSLQMDYDLRVECMNNETKINREVEAMVV